MICPDTIIEISLSHSQQQYKRQKIAPFHPSWEKLFRLFHYLRSQEHEGIETNVLYRGADLTWDQSFQRWNVVTDA